MRHGRVDTIAPRAAGKSFICVLALILISVFRPGSHQFMCSPGKQQSVKIASAKIQQIFELLPLLKKEVLIEKKSNDYYTLIFRNTSILDILTPLNSTRGNRANCGILDEYRDHKAEDINEIILPLLNVDRPMKNQDYNEYEPQQVQFWISSASDKNTYCYDKTVEFFEDSIINPAKTFCWGFDFRVPVSAGLLSKDFLTELKLSGTFNELGFAKEYMSRFVGSSNDAWFDYEKLLSCRHLVNPESHAKFRDDIESFYVISVDIARLKCQTVATILKVFPRRDTPWKVNLVNLFVLGKTESEKVFDKQVIELKKLIELFCPKEVVIDINGIGVSFADSMIKESFDATTGKTYPAYGFSNRNEYRNLQPKEANKILYGIKANLDLNSQMHSILYSKVYSGLLNFLIPESVAKTKLMSTRRGAKMSPEERNKRLLPHELTTILLDEIMNLKQKPTGNSNQIVVEQINKRMTKDKFSALEMGIYRVQTLENDFISKRQNRGLGRRLVFTTKARG